MFVKKERHKYFDYQIRKSDVTKMKNESKLLLKRKSEGMCGGKNVIR